MNSVQPYSSGGWTYLDELKKWVNNGMNTADTGFIDGASGIVNRGCHNPPNCGTGELHAGKERASHFKKVIKAMGLEGGVKPVAPSPAPLSPGPSPPAPLPLP